MATLQEEHRLMRDLLRRIFYEDDHDKNCSCYNGEECNCTMYDRHHEEIAKLIG